MANPGGLHKYDVPWGQPAGNHLRDAIIAKLQSYLNEDYVDDALPQYIVMLLNHGHTYEQLLEELEEFLPEDAGSFITWLFKHLEEHPDLYPKQVKSSKSDKHKDQSKKRSRSTKEDGAGGSGLKRQRSSREGREGREPPPTLPPKDSRLSQDLGDLRRRDSARGKMWEALVERRSSGLLKSKRRDEYWKSTLGDGGEQDLEEGELDERAPKRSKKKSILERLGGGDKVKHLFSKPRSKTQSHQRGQRSDAADDGADLDDRFDDGQNQSDPEAREQADTRAKDTKQQQRAPSQPAPDKRPSENGRAGSVQEKGSEREERLVDNVKVEVKEEAGGSGEAPAAQEKPNGAEVKEEKQEVTPAGNDAWQRAEEAKQQVERMKQLVKEVEQAMAQQQAQMATQLAAPLTQSQPQQTASIPPRGPAHDTPPTSAVTGPAKVSSGETGAGKTVLVSGLPPTVNPLQVAAHFKMSGTVSKVTLLASALRKPVGVAYVEFQHATSIPKALALSTTKLDGHTIQVQQKDRRQGGLTKLQPVTGLRVPYIPPRPLLRPPVYPASVYGGSMYGRAMASRPPGRASAGMDPYGMLASQGWPRGRGTGAPFRGRGRSLTFVRQPQSNRTLTSLTGESGVKVEEAPGCDKAAYETRAILTADADGVKEEVVKEEIVKLEIVKQESLDGSLGGAQRVVTGGALRQPPLVGVEPGVKIKAEG